MERGKTANHPVHRLGAAHGRKLMRIETDDRSFRQGHGGRQVTTTPTTLPKPSQDASSCSLILYIHVNPLCVPPLNYLRLHGQEA